MTIGVLAIQGDFAAHIRAIEDIGADAIEVRCAAELDNIDALIIPGGESTTMMKFLDDENLAQPIIDFARAGRAVFGTCAGAIVLARDVYNPPQASLGLIDIGVERNGYGRQVDSFVARADTTLDGGPLEAVFIRAPRIRDLGPEVEVLASLDGEPVMLRQNSILVATFHPELTEDRRVHVLLARLETAGGRGSDSVGK